MARNVEIKARVADRDAIVRRAAALATEGPVEIDQDDTFFRCENGRLKLRTFAQDRGELIFYRRADARGPKESFYVRSPTVSPGTLRESLALAYGVTGRVKKARTLYLAGRTRIHVDRVEGLGDFVELEVVLEDGEDVEAGMREARDLMAKLGIDAADLEQSAYVDLPASRESPC
ncbi:MAG: class IV adenylate cyclase [Burkholderiales bacterium]